jgi:putative membrane protein
MKHKSLIKLWTSLGGVVAVVLLMNLPGAAQVAPHSGASGGGQVAPTATPTAPPSSPMTSTSSLDQEFMKMAANSDQFEVRTSQLALEKTSNPEVKRYAQKMIQEHTESTQQLTQLASQRAVTLPSSPDPFQQAIIAQLTPLTGTQFDRAYLAAQTNGHMLTVAVFQTEIGQGKDRDIQSFASKLLPTIAGHYQMANQMNGQQNVLNSLSRNPMHSQ